MENPSAKLQLEVAFPLLESLFVLSYWTTTKPSTSKLKIRCSHETMRKEELLSTSPLACYQILKTLPRSTAALPGQRKAKVDGKQVHGGGGQSPSGRTQKGKASSRGRTEQAGTAARRTKNTGFGVTAPRNVCPGKAGMGQEALIVSRCKTLHIIATIRNQNIVRAAAAVFSG